MGDWFEETILDTGRLPLFCFFAAFVLTFAFIRFSVRMIRAQVSWWPGNITPGGLHIHHVVFGTVAVLEPDDQRLIAGSTWTTSTGPRRAAAPSTRSRSPPA